MARSEIGTGTDLCPVDVEVCFIPELELSVDGCDLCVGTVCVFRIVACLLSPSVVDLMVQNRPGFRSAREPGGLFKGRTVLEFSDSC